LTEYRLKYLITYLEARVQKEVLVDRQVREEAIKLKERGETYISG
jgi:hypothetical protein